jgi:hypothetical protein
LTDAVGIVDEDMPVGVAVSVWRKKTMSFFFLAYWPREGLRWTGPWLGCSLGQCWWAAAASR